MSIQYGLTSFGLIHERTMTTDRIPRLKNYTLVHHADELLRPVRVKLRAGLIFDYPNGISRTKRFPVRAVAGQRVIRVRNSDDPRP